MAPSPVPPERNEPRGRSDLAGYRLSSADHDENVDSEKATSRAILIALPGRSLKSGRGGQALPRQRLHCQLPFISPDLRRRNWSYLSEDSLTLSRTCSMILLASPSKALMLPKLAGADIPRQGQKSFRAFRTFQERRTAVTGSGSFCRRGLNRRDESRRVTGWGTVTRQSHERAGEDGQATVKSDDIFCSGHW